MSGPGRGDRQAWRVLASALLAALDPESQRIVEGCEPSQLRDEVEARDLADETPYIVLAALRALSADAPNVPEVR